VPARPGRDEVGPPIRRIDGCAGARAPASRLRWEAGAGLARASRSDVPRHIADRVNEANRDLARQLGRAVSAPRALDDLVGPWDEEEVARSRLDRARAREELIGERVAHRSQPELVDRARLSEQANRLEGATVLSG